MALVRIAICYHGLLVLAMAMGNFGVIAYDARPLYRSRAMENYKIGYLRREIT